MKVHVPLRCGGTAHLYQVDAHLPAVRRVLSEFNDLFPDDFYTLEEKHFEKGFWAVAEYTGPVGTDAKIIAFAGSVPFTPFDNFLYFKRVAVAPNYRGNSLQRMLMQITENFARQSGQYSHLISTTDIENTASANNFVRTGWLLTRPEKPWEPSSLYWIKRLAT